MKKCYACITFFQFIFISNNSVLQTLKSNPMCGRYVVVSKVRKIEKRFNVKSDQGQLFAPNYNVSHGDMVPVICNTAPHELQFYQFGFTPNWAKKQTYVINARSEGDQNQSNDRNYNGAMGIIQKPMFRNAIRSKRCLVIADCFVEGPKVKKLDEPYLMYLRDQNRPFAFAGIWDEWTQGDVVIKSFAILTTVANDLTHKIGHHRSPVILSKEDEQTWLSNDTPLNEVLGLLQPFPASLMNGYRVGDRIKNPKNNDLKLLDPIGERIFAESEYTVNQHIALEGMGSTAARKRRNKEVGK